MGDTLDPEDWPAFRKTAHKMLDAALDKMQSASDGPVWVSPDGLKAAYDTALPVQGQGIAATQKQIEALLPYGVGNTHPRFFGWVHGAGSTSGLIADIATAAMNANLGGRHHGAMLVEKQVVAWCREMFEFPETSSGLVVSGTSMATIIALKVARDHAGDGHLVGYTSCQTHSCVARAFDMLGIGCDALRLIPVNAAFEMDISALQSAIDADRAAGLQPFCIIGTAGSVNVGAIDDLDALADIAAVENLWFHIDGAFGAAGVLADRLRPRLTGLPRADSLAFDFHKWLHVNYDAGFVLIRNEAKHRASFSDRPDYLAPATRGLAAGNPWPVEYGPELSRGFRALKIWAQINEHGVARLGQMITRNCEQAKLLERLVIAHPKLEMVAPVAMQIVCFRHIGSDALNEEIVLRLQEEGIAVPSTTRINGRLAIRVNITNHRTTDEDLQVLVDGICRLGGFNAP
ncbi:MAG: pyridoxal-dependent decarboxylase [Rhodobacteraceae bacterium]|nr:pyridoxal-dependent decarboxylase [Paracoccaceae bacterium]